MTQPPTKWLLVLICFSLLTSCSIVKTTMSDVETPNYQVLSSDDNIQIRQYPKLILAEVKVEGKRREAINRGFKVLADYIFGNNISQKDIQMTAPVQQQAQEKIAMTAPVQQQLDDNRWSISFIMPSQYSLKSLPKPKNKRITVVEMPQKKYIAIRFSGTSSEKNLSDNQQTLVNYINKNNLSVTGSAILAFYNPPWTLPFMRRNEILFELKQ